MDDFIKNIKQNLDHASEPEFRSDDWDQLVQKLDGQHTANQKGLLKYWWIPIFLLLLGSQVCLFSLWRNTSSQVQDLTSQLHQTSSSSNFKSYLDTIYQTKIIYRTDTLTRIIKVATNSGDASVRPTQSTNTFLTTGTPYYSPNQRSWPISRYENRTFNPFHQTQFNSLDNKNDNVIIGNSNPLFTEYTNPFIQSNTNQKLTENTKYTNSQLPDHIMSVAIFLPFPAISLFHYKAKIDPLDRHLFNQPRIAITKKNRAQLFDNFRPQGFYLEGDIGYQTANHSLLNYKNDISIKLAGYVHMSKALDFWIDGTYSSLSFETNDLEHLPNLPTIEPPSPDLKFKMVEAQRPAVFYSVGAMYTHPTGNRWRPQIGIGINATSIFAYDLISEFQDPTNNVEWSLEQGMSSQFNFADKVIFKAGMKYALTDVWRAHIRASFYKDILGSNNPNLLSIRLGLGYEF